MRKVATEILSIAREVMAAPSLKKGDKAYWVLEYGSNEEFNPKINFEVVPVRITSFGGKQGTGVRLDTKANVKVRFYNDSNHRLHPYDKAAVKTYIEAEGPKMSAEVITIKLENAEKYLAGERTK